uniref:DNA replication licensing factor MCM4 n=1 Tax=Aceria tosichella TaxID=561515 RepID=A0A6G1SC75_9ACAR
MSVSQTSTRGTDHGSLPNVLFPGPSSGSFRYASQPSEQDPASATGEAAAPNLVIWGTDVSVETAKKQLMEFIRESRFTVEEAEMDEARLEWQRSEEPRPLYLTKLEEILQVPNEPYLTVNCAHLKEFNPSLYRKLVFYPNEVVSIFDMAANEVFQDLYPEHDHIVISVRPFNIDQTYTIRGLNPDDIGKLVTINGMVTRCSSIIPEMVRAFFKCHICSFTREVAVDNGRIQEPHVCTACNSKFSFVLIHNRCKYIDRQLLKLQESPDDMPAGQTPSTVALVACADLVDKVNPGDRLYVTGIYRASSVRVHPRIRKLNTAFRTCIDCIHFRKVKAGRLHDESSHLRFNPDRVDKLKALAKDDNIYTRMAHSLCPSIFGHQDVKKGVLLQLFGGTRKEAPGSHSDPKLRHFRSDINILLCGDPGTSKSQILQYVYKLVPRGQYTSGKGSSAVGLTAYITRDLDTNQLVLQTGALVMCDGGICCIDEFDKMTDSTRSILHEVMEQQTLSVAKAGIVCQLNARTSILAAANPVSSAWDKNKNVIDNIKLPDTLLSRFDLIFLLLDPNNEAYDSRLARHLISLYHGNDDVDVSDKIPQDLLKDYIAYARANVHPKLTPEACELLTQNYIKLRTESHTSEGRITYYPRNLESLIRLSEAHARLRLSSVVDADDITEAVRLTKEAAMHDFVDPNTGKIASGVVIFGA